MSVVKLTVLGVVEAERWQASHYLGQEGRKKQFVTDR